MDRPVTRRDWWLGVAIVAAAVLVHALLPRYDWLLLREETADVLRIDRWPGDARHMRLIEQGDGRMAPLASPRGR